MSLLLYNISVRFYWVGIFIASLFNRKAKLWITGRKNWDDQLRDKPASIKKTAWFHCASLGEFEQARPLIEKLKTEHPHYAVVLTFFSPSGYEVRKNYDLADAVMYLPLDTRANAENFLNKVKPDIAFFVKYEFWYHYLNGLQKRKTPAILFSAIFRREQVFFKWYGGLFRAMLRVFTQIFVQEKESQQLLSAIGVKSEVAHDTRFDRVYSIAQNRKPIPLIEQFKGHSKVFIAGSTWPKDEELLLELIKANTLKQYKYIIAPHNIEQARIDTLIKSLPIKAQRFSELNNANAESTELIIVDSIGQLTSIYAYGTIAYVGGGFNASVHNVLEPAVYGMPVIFGPNYKKSAEAKELIALGAAAGIQSYDELRTVCLGLNTDNRLEKASAIAKGYVRDNTGGTEQVWLAVSNFIG